jgi:hypothetical protein
MKKDPIILIEKIYRIKCPCCNYNIIGETMKSVRNTFLEHCNLSKHTVTKINYNYKLESILNV